MDPRLHAFHEILLVLWINENNSGVQLGAK